MRALYEAGHLGRTATRGAAGDLKVGAADEQRKKAAFATAPTAEKWAMVERQ